ncbi:hypothetical protein CH251_15265 [Rhodococcus sp. 06-462-5]|nr:hypothetical protein CH251_15265 [Rhodococcus sp. 06-462-5]OZE70582.1 hypothetical protein CH270_01220 [Rhodococcus sp. 02-925g]
MIDMNDAFRFAASCSSPRELIARLQFGMTELWPEDTAIPVRWHCMADLIDSERGLLVELDGAVSKPVVDALAATAELCRQSASEPVPQSDWRLLRRALEWLECSGSEVDRALLAVGDEVALVGLDSEDEDLSVATWLCIEALDRFAATEDALGYWVHRLDVHESKLAQQPTDSDRRGSETSALPMAV